MWESPLQLADLLDQLSVSAFIACTVDFAEHLTDDSEEQIHEDDDVEENAGEEEQPLSV